MKSVPVGDGLLLILFQASSRTSSELCQEEEGLVLLPHEPEELKTLLSLDLEGLASSPIPSAASSPAKTENPTLQGELKL